MIEHDLSAIEDLAGAMVRNLAPGARRGLMRRMARNLAGSQTRRIGRQQAPDGSAFPARKEKQAPARGAYAVKFLYPKGAAEPRLVFMKSWARQGPLLTGFDIEAGAIRSFFWDKVDRWLPLEAGEQNKSGGSLRRRGAIRRGAMFRKMRLSRFLRAGASDAEAWAGFSGSVARIARVHQEGGMDRPALKARPVRYARRELLGVTDTDRTRLLDLLLDHIA